MNRKDIIFGAIALAVIGLFIFLSLIGRQAKPMTARSEHASVNRDTPRETCWGCHAPDSTVAPMPPRHPKKGKPPDTTTPCYACHKLPDAAVAVGSLNETGEEPWLRKQQK